MSEPSRATTIAVVHYRVAGGGMADEGAARTARFGLFEVDLVSGELWKDGTRIRLQEQPFRVLVMLLERPGEMVTREQLRNQLWPGDTFVDFDHGLNTAVNKLREALGDAAANPRFIQTIARRGYRLIAPVQRNGAARASAEPADPEGPGERRAQRDLHPELQVPVPRRGLTRGMFLLIQLMYLIFYVAALFRWQGVQRVAEQSLPGRGAWLVAVAVLVTAGVGIPLRFYLIAGVAFDDLRFGETFRRLFFVILVMDELWAIAPFLLVEKIGFGPAFAATAGLLYLPFSERSLVRLAYRDVS